MTWRCPLTDRLHDPVTLLGQLTAAWPNIAPVLGVAADHPQLTAAYNGFCEKYERERKAGEEFADFCAVYGLPATLTNRERLWLRMNLERARQLQVHTVAEGVAIASGGVGSDAYYCRWGDPTPLKDAAILDDYLRRKGL